MKHQCGQMRVASPQRSSSGPELNFSFRLEAGHCPPMFGRSGGPQPASKRFMSPTLILPALAKINLSLRVLAKRHDGYHDLDTIYQTISLHDTIKFSASDGPHVVVSCNDRTLPADENNLIVRAAKALQSRFAAGQGAFIRLDKRIPMQAGLGGGSSDAAVTLIALARLWQINLTRAELITLGSELGADVSFFFYGGTARATGVGDRIEPLADTREKFLLVVKP